jgi:hypothetical protein
VGADWSDAKSGMGAGSGAQNSKRREGQLMELFNLQRDFAVKDGWLS